MTNYFTRCVWHSFRIQFQTSTLISKLKKIKDNLPSNKGFLFIRLLVSSQKVWIAKNSELMPSWLTMRLCVDVCEKNRALSRYGKVPKLNKFGQPNQCNVTFFLPVSFTSVLATFYIHNVGKKITKKLKKLNNFFILCIGSPFPPTGSFLQWCFHV